jgi:hypothetical protein
VALKLASTASTLVLKLGGVALKLGGVALKLAAMALKVATAAVALSGGRGGARATDAENRRKPQRDLEIFLMQCHAYLL